uniref:Uncharacterized protein n=1 Tax=Heterorhabditis bacteriophora TaxID=37862 RepID=A0A1I7WM25_HETBA
MSIPFRNQKLNTNTNNHGQLNDSYNIRRTPSVDSDDSFNDYSNDSLSINLSEKRTPLRPPPPYNISDLLYATQMSYKILMLTKVNLFLLLFFLN